MSLAEGLAAQLEATRKTFNTTVSIFTPGDAGFAPQPELYTVAGHIAHTADSVDWFIEGAFGRGWDMDFALLIETAKAVTSLDEAKQWLEKAFKNAIEVVGNATDENLMSPITDQRIMGGAPKSVVVNGIVDHTAHHRGALAVYARLIGKEPPMPYS